MTLAASFFGGGRRQFQTLEEHPEHPFGQSSQN